MQDAVDTIFAAAQSGNVSTVPDKFLTPEYIKTIKKLIKRGDFTQDQGNDIITAINEINNIDTPKKETNKKKNYEPKYNSGGNDGTTQADVNINNTNNLIEFFNNNIQSSSNSSTDSSSGSMASAGASYNKPKKSSKPAFLS